jgi:Carbohydrate-selective porin, OprB family
MSCCDDDCHVATADTGYRRILWAALGINVAMFLVEIVASFIAGSVSLRADAARADRLAGPPNIVRNYAAVIELSYKASVSPGWTVQPDLQYVINLGNVVGSPNRTEVIPNALILGLRTTLKF